MKDFTELKPDLDNPVEKSAFEVVKTLHKAGFKAYWVGGHVRNRLLNLSSDEIDVATDAPPEKVIKLFPRTISVGAKFGVIMVLKNGIQTEVATFRTESGYKDRRHPDEVEFSDAKTDAQRRDFTINALFWDPESGEVLDFVNGKRDLDNRLVRAIGNPSERFREDALRLIRAMRFAARFAFRIEDNTWHALIQNSPLILSISPERIRDELVKIFTGPNRGVALDLLDRSKLLGILLPEVESMKGVPQPEKFHPEGDCYEHTKLTIEWLRDPSPTLAMGGLLHDIGKPPTYEVKDRIRFSNHTKVGEKLANDICKRLRFSNEQKTKITQLVDRHMHFMNVRDMKTSTLKKFLSHPNIEEDLELHRADCLASHGDLSNYHFCVEKLKEFRSESESQEVLPPPLITGNDLIEAGYKPGPLFSEILEIVRDAQLDGEIETKEAAMHMVREKFPC